MTRNYLTYTPPYIGKPVAPKKPGWLPCYRQRVFSVLYSIPPVEIRRALDRGELTPHWFHNGTRYVTLDDKSEEFIRKYKDKGRNTLKYNKAIRERRAAVDKLFSDLYLNEKLSIRGVARATNTDASTVYRSLQAQGVEFRRYTQRQIAEIRWTLAQRFPVNRRLDAYLRKK